MAATTALFGYDLASGELLAEYALDDDNDDPRGIWSDRVTVWVSDHIDKRLFAYRLPSIDEADEGAETETADLERVTGEEFTKLSAASNNSPRGIWSDGDVMYVADASDGKVYTYNMLERHRRTPRRHSRSAASTSVSSTATARTTRALRARA